MSTSSDTTEASESVAVAVGSAQLLCLQTEAAAAA